MQVSQSDRGSRNDHQLPDELIGLVYDQLRRIAQQRIQEERGGHTLQATALVHEVYLKLTRDRVTPWSGRAAFFTAAAEAMRRILIDHARKHSTAKRGRTYARIPLLNVADLAAQSDPHLTLALDEAIVRLEREEPRAAAVVRLRFYAGLSVEEAAETLGVSRRTVLRDWDYARVWLCDALETDD